jgi:hypothetical protein
VPGPLEVPNGDRSLPLGGAKQRALLALLILNANRIVSRERLIDELWGDDPRETARTMVQVYVSRLRKLLPHGTLVTRPPGYSLEVEPEQVDLLRFLAGSAAGRVRGAVRAGRGRPARRTPTRGARGADRGRACARPAGGAGRRATDAAIGSTDSRSPWSWPRRAFASCRRRRCSRACSLPSRFSREVRATHPRDNGRSAPRSNGAMGSSSNRSRSCSPGCRASRAASRSTPRRRCARRRSTRPTRSPTRASSSETASARGCSRRWASRARSARTGRLRRRSMRAPRSLPHGARRTSVRWET